MAERLESAVAEEVAWEIWETQPVVPHERLEQMGGGQVRAAQAELERAAEEGGVVEVALVVEWPWACAATLNP